MLTIRMGISLVGKGIILDGLDLSRGWMLPTVEADHFVPLIASGRIMVEVLDLEVATEPLTLNEDTEVAVGTGKDAGEQGLTLGGIEVLVAIAGLPPEVFHGAMPLTIGVDLLHHFGKVVTHALPLKGSVHVIRVLIESPRKIGLDFSGGGHGVVAHNWIIPYSW